MYEIFNILADATNVSIIEKETKDVFLCNIFSEQVSLI